MRKTSKSREVERVEPLRLPPALCVGVLLVAVIILLSPAIFTGKGLVPTDGVFLFPPWSKTASVKPANLPLADQYLQFVPYRQFYYDELWKGRFPLWNPHLMAGVPSLAGIQGAALFPTNLFLSPIHPFYSAALAALAKLFAAGLFTFLFLRRIGTSAAAAAVGGVTFSLSGFMVVWLGHPHTNVATLLPVLFYALEGVAASPRNVGRSIGLAVAFGLMLLGGHPPTMVHVVLAVAAYTGFRLWSVDEGQGRRFLMGVGAAMIGGVLLASIQILPFLEYYRLSSASAASVEMQRAVNHLLPGTLYFLLLPFLSGSPSAGFDSISESIGFGRAEYFNEHTLYVGVLALFLALVAVIRRRDPRTRFFAGLVLVALTIVYGVPPWPPILGAVPVINSINHERLILWVEFGLAVLAGMGADAIFGATAAKRPRAAAIAFGATVLLALGIVWHLAGSSLDSAAKAFVGGQLWVPVVGVVVAVVITLKRVPVTVLAGLCLTWTAADLLMFGTGFNPAVPKAQYYPATGATKFLQADPSVFRIVGASAAFMPNTAGVYGLDDLRGQDFMTVARFEELMTGQAGNFYFFQRVKNLPAALPLMNTKYLVAPERAPAPPAGFELAYNEEVAIYRNTHFRERAIGVFGYQVESNPDLVLAHVRAENFNPEQMVWLEEEPGLAGGGGDAAAAGQTAETRITAYAPDRVTIEATLSKPGLVLLTDTYFPGWRATVDGRDTKVLRADYAFRAVAVPAGSHTIVFTYGPASFTLGAGLTLVTLLGMGTLFVWDRRKRRTA